MAINVLIQYRALNEPFTWFDITFWAIAALILIFIALFTLYSIKFKPKDITDLQKTNAITWAISFVLLFVSIVLMLLWKYSIKDILISGIIDNTVVALVNSAIIIKIIHMEYSINKYEFYKGYYFTIAVIALFTFTMIFTPSALREIGIFQVIYLTLFLGGISIFPLMFLYLAIKLKGRERLMAIRIVFGTALLAVGFVLQPQNIESYSNIIPNFDIFMNFFLFMCPIFVSTGALIIFSSFKGNL